MAFDDKVGTERGAGKAPGANEAPAARGFDDKAG